MDFYFVVFSLFCTFIVNINLAQTVNDELAHREAKNIPPLGLWHSHLSKTGVKNREVLHLSKIKLWDFTTLQGVKKWMSTEETHHTTLVGLGEHFIVWIKYDDEKADHEVHHSDINGKTSDLAIYENWNTTLNRNEVFVVVSVLTQEEYFLKWYKVSEQSLEFMLDWPLHRHVTHLEVFEINNKKTLMIIERGHPAHPGQPTVEFYNFVMDDNLDMWLYDRFVLKAVPSSAIITRDGEQFYFSVSLPFLGVVDIFAYNSDGHFTLHQEIQSVGVTSLASFQIGSSSYLAMGSSSSAIYRFQDAHNLIRVTKSNLGLVRQWLPVPLQTYRGDTILLAQGTTNISVIISDEKDEFQKMGHLSQMICGDVPDKSCLHNLKGITIAGGTAIFQDTPKILLPTTDGSSVIMKVDFELQPILSEIEIKMKAIIKKKEELEETWKRQLIEIEKVSKELPSLSEDSHGGLYENLNIKELKAGIVIFDPSKPIVVHDTEFVGKPDWAYEDMFIDKADLKSLISYVTDELEKVTTNLKHHKQHDEFVLTPEMSGNFTIWGTVHANELEIKEINDENVSETIADLYRLDRPQEISGVKTFDAIEVQSINFETLGDIPACDIFFSDPIEGIENVIHGDIVFEHDVIVAEDIILEAGGKVNGLYIDKDFFRPEIAYNSALNFEDLRITGEANIKRTINGVPFIVPLRSRPIDLSSLSKVHGSQVGLVNVEKDLNASFINGKNVTELKELLKNIGTPYSDVEVNGVLTVTDMDIEYLNDVKFPEDYILADTKEPIIITGEKTFTGKVSVDNLEIDPEVLHRFLGEQRSSVPKNAESNTSYYFENLELDGIIIAEYINEKSWSTFRDIVKNNDVKPEIRGRKHFGKGMTVASIEVKGTLNGGNITDILTDKDQMIPTLAVFPNITMKDVQLSGLWRGVDVVALNASLIRHDAFLNSTLVFEDPTQPCIVANRLRIIDSIGEITPERVYQQGKDVDIDGDIRFSSLKVDQLVVNGSVIVLNTVNDVNLSDFDNRRVSLTRSQTITNDLTYDNLTIHGDLSAQSINGRNSLLSRTMNLTEMLLTGLIHKLNNIVVEGNLNTKKGINNVVLMEIEENAINITESNDITVEMEFVDKVVFDHLNINEINSVRLNSLFEDYILENKSDLTVVGKKLFMNGIKVKNLNVTRINGCPVSLFQTKDQNQILKGPVRITGKVRVRNNLNSYGTVNGADLSAVHKRYSSQHNSYIVEGDLSLQQPISVKNLAVGGEINSVNFDSFLADALRKDDKSEITGHKIFTGEVIFKKNLTIQTINNLNFSEWYDDIVMTNKPSKIAGTLIIRKAIMKDLKVRNDFNASLINGCDVKEWLEESIPLDGRLTVEGKKTFENVIVHTRINTDFVNGYSTDKMVILKEKQFIPVPMHFPSVNVTSEIVVMGLVNGKSLTTEYEDTVMDTGHQVLSERITFLDEILVEGNLIVGEINGRKVEDLITLDTEQTISNPIAFKGKVTVDDLTNVTIINGIDMDDWKQRSVSVNESQDITGIWTVLGNVTVMGDVHGKGLLDGVNISSLSQRLEKKKSMHQEVQGRINEELNKTCQDIHQYSSIASKQLYLFQYFNFIQQFDFVLTPESILTFQANHQNYMLITFEEHCRSSLHRWNDNLLKYIFLNEVNLGPVSKWLSLERENETILVTSASRAGVKCEHDDNLGHVWVFGSEDGEYQHLPGLESFVDVMKHDGSQDKFFVLNLDGRIQEVRVLKDMKLGFTTRGKVDGDNYRFVPFDIGVGLAVTNGIDIKKFSTDGSVQVLSNGRMPGLDHSASASSHVNHRTLTAVSHTNSVLVYENVILGDLYSSLEVKNPGSIVWLNFGMDREAFLLVAVDKKAIEIFQYRGVSGLKRTTTLMLPSKNLQVVELPDKVTSQKYLIVTMQRKVVIFNAHMLGRLYEKSDDLC